jgi:hypothetical protein
MNRPLVKTPVVMIISLVLLYYSVAWAVLRCPHQENHLDHEPALYNTTSYKAEVSSAFPDHDQASLDCTGPSYHTEFLAGAAPGSELLRLTRDVPSRGNILLPLLRTERNQAEYVSRKAVFDKGFPHNFLIDLPRYLSLSVFRF